MFIIWMKGAIMKSFATILCVMLTLLAAVASGQEESTLEQIGIFADLEGRSDKMNAESGLLQLYVLALNVQAEAGISIWEMGLDSKGSVGFLDYQIPYPALDVSRFPNIVVAASDPLPPAPVIHLLTLTYEVVDDSPVELYITEFTGGYPPEGGSLNNYLPVYLTGPVGSSEMYNLHPVSGSIDEPVFRLNGKTPVSLQTESWGNLKALFR
jgi:hypothetical protein